MQVNLDEYRLQIHMNNRNSRHVPLRWLSDNKPSYSNYCWEILLKTLHTVSISRYEIQYSQHLNVETVWYEQLLPKYRPFNSTNLTADQVTE
jgi:intergrase/recombinase